MKHSDLKDDDDDEVSVTLEVMLVFFSQYGKMFVNVRGSKPARIR